MKSWILGTAAWLAVGSVWAAPPPSGPPPLEVYAAASKIADVTISPDGLRLAAIVTKGGTQFVELYNAETLQPVQRLPAGDKILGGLQWAGPHHLIVGSAIYEDGSLFSPGRGEFPIPIDLNLETGKARELIHSTPGAPNMLRRPPMVREQNGRPVVFMDNVYFGGAGGAHPSLFRIDLDGGQGALVEEGSDHDWAWLVDAEGQKLARETWNTITGQWTVRFKHGGDWSIAAQGKDLFAPPRLWGLGTRAGSVAIYTETDGLGALRQVTAETSGPPVRAIPENAVSVIHDPKDQTIIAYGLADDDRVSIHWLDPHDQARWDGVRKAYAGADVMLQSMSFDRSKWVVEVTPPDDTPAYALVDFHTGASQWVGETYPEIRAFLGHRSTFHFKASDGLALSGYLTLPPRGGTTSLPLVVLPHGGPAGRDRPGFDALAQALASRGYAVLQVNYRGSQVPETGLKRAGFGEMGRKMQTDLSDGVQALVAQGTVDPKRVCIVGAGYGGYAALAGVTLQHGVYRCAVSISGVFDMRPVVDGPPNEQASPLKRTFRRYLGVEGVDDPRVDEVSPIRHVADLDVPVLLIQGKAEAAIRGSQTSKMSEALAKAGKAYEVVTLKEEDPATAPMADRLQQFQAIVDFLAKNNPA